MNSFHFRPQAFVLSLALISAAGLVQERAFSQQAARPAYLTLTGTVQRRTGPTEFTLLTRRGNVVSVRVPPEVPAPVFYSTARVRVYGHYVGQFFLALNTRVLGVKSGGQGEVPLQPRKNAYTGTVTRLLPGNSFALRLRNRSVYVVDFPAGRPKWLVARGRVRAYGYWKDGVVNVTNLRLLGTNRS